jgi:DNA polymerase-3 subunit beta
MKLTIKRTEFLKLLTYAAQAIPSRSAENQFLNYLIQVEENKVSVIASDGNISTKASVEQKDNKGNDVIINATPGLIQTPAKYLLEMISKLSGEIITLNMVDTNYLNISDDVTDFNLVTKDGRQYPDVDLNIPEDAKGIKVSITDLKNLFDTTSFAVAVKGPKELFYGINISANEGKLTFLATDSYRVARLSIPEENENASFTFTCPVKAIDMVTRVDASQEVEIFFDEQRALFVAGNIILSTRLLRGDFPSVDRLIPPEFPYQVKVNREEFLSAAERVRIISSAEDRNSLVKFTLHKENGVTLSARSANFGNSQEKLKKVVVTLPEEVNVFEIGFNVEFVLDALKALRSEEVTFVFASPTRMFMLKNDNPNNTQIVTPIRLASTI